MKLNQSQPVITKGTRPYYESHYTAARSNLLLMIAFSLVNLVLLLLESDTYFLFSSSFSYNVAWLGQYFAADYGMSLYYVAIAVSFIWLLLFFVCWLLSKNKPGWIVAATVLFVLDCVFMALSFFIFVFSISTILDIIFHVAVLVYLIRGCIAIKKLKEMPEPMFEQPSVDYTTPDLPE